MKKILILIYCLIPGLVHAELAIGYSRVFEALDFERPILLTHAGDDSDRLFVAEQGGRIKVFPNDPTITATKIFFDLAQMTDNSISVGGEEGLLGLAFDPNYKDNGYFYVYYSAKKPRRSVISRFSTRNDNPNLALFDSEVVLLEIIQPYSNHNGGMLAFGPDGNLYIGTGDGGSGGDPQNNAQNLASPLGKILRVDVNGHAVRDNPFINVANADARIWAYGLRNPWRFSFDGHTGLLWAGDVGQNEWEEVDIISKGDNLGWRWYEGTHEYHPDPSMTAEVIKPLFEYSHQDGNSITGGYVYRGVKYPRLTGWYHFGDFASGQLWVLNTEHPILAAVKSGRVNNPSSFGVDQQGELYVVSYRGSVFQVVVEP